MSLEIIRENIRRPCVFVGVGGRDRVCNVGSPLGSSVCFVSVFVNVTVCVGTYMYIDIGVGKSTGDREEKPGPEANLSSAAAARCEECGGEWDGAQSERRQGDVSVVHVGGTSSLHTSPSP